MKESAQHATASLTVKSKYLNSDKGEMDAARTLTIAASVIAQMDERTFILSRRH